MAHSMNPAPLPPNWSTRNRISHSPQGQNLQRIIKKERYGKHIFVIAARIYRNHDVWAFWVWAHWADTYLGKTNNHISWDNTYGLIGQFIHMTQIWWFWIWKQRKVNTFSCSENWLTWYVDSLKIPFLNVFIHYSACFQRCLTTVDKKSSPPLTYQFVTLGPDT